MLWNGVSTHYAEAMGVVKPAEEERRTKRVTAEVRGGEDFYSNFFFISYHEEPTRR